MARRQRIAPPRLRILSLLINNLEILLTLLSRYDGEAYDMQPQCNDYIIIAQSCRIIKSGSYNPVLVVPTQVRNLDPAWYVTAFTTNTQDNADKL
jgi:hypothetical protein